MTHKHCRLIAFEGGDGVGKFTHSTVLLKQLQHLGKKVVRVQIPIKSKFTHILIYKMLENGYASKYPNLFQAIQFINKLQFQLMHLVKLMNENDYVIFDRWSMSCFVYGVASGANKEMVSWMSDMLIRPHLTFILTSYDGSMRECARDEYESNESMQSAVRKMYQDISLMNRSIDERDVTYITTSKSFDTMSVGSTIIAKLKDRFGKL